jgi:septum formation protein
MIRLASASPRRRELLTQIGVPHVITVPHVDEAALPDERPAEYVQRIARSKAEAVWNKDQSLPVLAADTTVVLDGTMFGKPSDRAEAMDMLGRLSGRTHDVLTAVALAHAGGLSLRMSVSEVRFRTLSEEECGAYWDTEEPHDKAGGYAIQGLAAVFIESMTGSYSGVMGLPLFETAELLREAGVHTWCTMAP